MGGCKGGCTDLVRCQPTCGQGSALSGHLTGTTCCPKLSTKHAPRPDQRHRAEVDLDGGPVERQGSHASPPASTHRLAWPIQPRGRPGPPAGRSFPSDPLPVRSRRLMPNHLLRACTPTSVVDVLRLFKRECSAMLCCICSYALPLT